ncbi:hypothetical protein KK062_10135 [Fulvivirgaceae bacterium PWU5]|uniref:Uncharacterized protein n=1 Tax=Dawidia cretensis TaxID=2782350 RepID=A0AAP2DWB1_9BACT|nr:hypothetical protein [Dawidia cretensis]MBT1708586.1 hypothetical protein [Dawidia cretensis]
MAYLTELKFSGSLGDFTAYKMRGTDKTVVRRKGGASKETIRTSRRFATARLWMTEFGGCSTMGKEVRFMMSPMKALADYNFSGFVNKALKQIQKLDGVSALGRRAIRLSQYPELLQGFSLNKYTTFDSMVRTAVTCTIDRATGSARINIPQLVRDINFFPNSQHPAYSIVVCLGVVPDFTFNSTTGKYAAPKWYDTMQGWNMVETPWYSSLKGSPAQTLDVVLNNTIPPDAGYSLQLTVGVQFGALHDNGMVKQVKRTGAAKILAIAGSESTDKTMPIIKPVSDTEAFLPETFLADNSQKAITAVSSPAPEMPAEPKACQEPPADPWKVTYTYTSMTDRAIDPTDNRRERVFEIGGMGLYHSGWSYGVQ